MLSDLVSGYGEIAYHYPYLQYGRAVWKRILSSGTTRSSGATGETVPHYRHLEFEDNFYAIYCTLGF